MTGDSEIEGDYSVDDEDQLTPADTLINEDVDDTLDRGYSPPDHYSESQHYGTTPWEEEHRETIDQRLDQEEPDVEVGEDDLAPPEDGDLAPEAGDQRAGRIGEDEDSDVFGHDVGVDGAAASAEEAAVHVMPDEEK
ncbi:hypothetical protein KUV85_09395 [Nocardioides panacisoli]|uniref:DUF5709 domain-containing protein n=1 Tax=Nocardioides panacisoli TaxID=627624 RepID=UPI001C635F1F|nr:DUF5709 domain-containing protein [Nocardioides panacisoli]QYJ02554.1 hypothetical protein KUV85_09395 [Nocardioides panacisoli]